MSQRFSLYEALTIDDNIRFFGGIYGLRGQAFEERRAFVLEMAGLKGREKTQTRDLAGGWRQRLALGLRHPPSTPYRLSRRAHRRRRPALAPTVLGPDRTLSQGGTTVLVTTHYLDEAEHCHRLAIIHAGKLAALGTARSLKERFSDRPIVEVQSTDPVAAMTALDSCRKSRRPASLEPPCTRCFATGASNAASIDTRAQPARRRRDGRREVAPSLEDVFLDVVETAEARR